MTFALALPDLSRPPPVAAPAPPDPALLEAIREAAEADGHARGIAEGLAEGMRRQAAAQDAAVARSLAEIAAALAEAADHGARAAAEAAEVLAGLLLAAMDAALPAETARHGADLVARVARELLPALADRPEAVLHVAPGLVEAVSARLPAGPEVQPDPALPEGDAHIAWRDGACLVSLAERRAAVRAALAAAGFHMTESDA